MLGSFGNHILLTRSLITLGDSPARPGASQQPPTRVNKYKNNVHFETPRKSEKPFRVVSEAASDNSFHLRSDTSFLKRDKPENQDTLKMKKARAKN